MVLLLFSAHALANLSVDPNLRARIVETGAPDALVELLEEPEVDAEVKTMAARCLANVTLIPQARQHLASHSSFLPLLVSSLHIPYTRLTIEILALMSNVSLDVTNGVELVRRGALRPIFASVKSKHPEAQHMAARLLRRLAAIARDRFISEGGLKCLVYMVQSGDSNLQREAHRTMEVVGLLSAPAPGQPIPPQSLVAACAAAASLTSSSGSNTHTSAAGSGTSTSTSQCTNGSMPVPSGPHSQAAAQSHSSSSTSHSPPLAAAASPTMSHATSFLLSPSTASSH
eukprot:TRINITY_DN10440_c0_g1::TRINITY_DN10440_c0_g1_i1::g.15311::m.15311 TRINITY_DN10440_c0_g1::TRINITY_DN10440_c0_g1_i1::g.15311  ORF type:complete len:301 (-),score=26.77,Arm/PF00514.18/5e+03,Arm/PF00514.18/0.0012,Arm/PF00514.18/1.3e+03,Arm/PF00514.18/31,Arm/PF00514.18/0.7,HEAT_2/PF13646.1/0.086,HEAT_2/PF13646.1/0.19,KAP/PF05804.7/0.004 TRINITY_DN10440_c0_g1_i1:125-982(-)